MKKILTLILGLVITITPIFSQSNENLNSDQKKECNRRKLVVEKVTESTSNMGWYWGFFSKRVDTWRAFRGLADLIEPEEFFRITGYTEEADKVKKNLEDANSKITLGAVLYIGGLVGYLIPKTETKDLGYGLTIEEVSYP